MKLTNKHPYRPDADTIRRYEKIWRVTLPEDYRQMLMETNGGIPEKRNFPCRNRMRMIERFLCILPDHDDPYACYDIGVVITQVEERITSDPDAYGCTLVPIAELFAGDLLCLDYRKGSSPTVCVWYHEESGEWEPVTEKAADSFSEFINILMQQGIKYERT